MCHIMKKFLRIVGFLFLILIAIFTVWFSKNWLEAGQQIKASKNYSKLMGINAFGPATENQKLILKMHQWTEGSYWPCSLFHSERHISSSIDRDFISNEAHKGKSIDWHKTRAFVSCRFERDFTTAQLRNYFFQNSYFGHGEYGVEKASNALFGKSFENLTKEEVIQIGIILLSPNLRNKQNEVNESLEYWLERLEDE